MSDVNLVPILIDSTKTVSLSTPAENERLAAPGVLRVALIILACATGLAVLDASRAVVNARLVGLPAPALAVVRQSVIQWYVWALLAPAVILLATRVPVMAEGRVRRLALHLVAGLSLASIHLWITVPVWYALAGPVWRRALPMDLGDMLVVRHMDSMVPNFVLYCMIAGAVHAYQYFRSLGESRVEAMRLSRQAAELERGLAESRLDALRKELNPHFLFNSLNAVAGLIRRSEGNDAIAMLARLSDLLRLTLDRDVPPEVPLEQELELLDKYLGIERIRFGDRLVFEVRATEEARHVLVPTLILQPLVENAVRHGVSNQPSAGFVCVDARVVDDRLEITVRDSGVGFFACVLDGETRGEARGVGLSNTRARLQQLYGDAATLVLRNAADGGAVVEISIPRDANDVSARTRA